MCLVPGGGDHEGHVSQVDKLFPVLLCLIKRELKVTLCVLLHHYCVCDMHVWAHVPCRTQVNERATCGGGSYLHLNLETQTQVAGIIEVRTEPAHLPFT